MSSVNKVILIGNLGADPELRTFQNGGQVCNLRIATSESWRDKQSGERKERTEWHTVSVMNEKLAQLCGQYLSKGSKVYIEGQLQTRKWQDQSGADRYSTEVVVRPFGGDITFLDKSDGGGERQEPVARRRDPEPQRGGGPSFNDDEIPFAAEFR